MCYRAWANPSEWGLLLCNVSQQGKNNHQAALITWTIHLKLRINWLSKEKEITGPSATGNGNAELKKKF